MVERDGTGGDLFRVLKIDTAYQVLQVRDAPVERVRELEDDEATRCRRTTSRCVWPA
jgi:hypothetical protein